MPNKTKPLEERKFNIYGIEKDSVVCIGPHRLLCGSSRRTSSYVALLGESKVDLVVTSPPYADGITRKYDKGSGFIPIRDDDYKDWCMGFIRPMKKFLNEDGNFILNIGMPVKNGCRPLHVYEIILEMVKHHGWQFADHIAWTKSGIPGKYVGRLKNQWESIYHMRFNKDAKFFGKRLGVLSHNAIRSGGTGRVATWQGNTGSSPSDIKNETAFAQRGNVLSFGNSNESCGHNATFPGKLPRFFIKLMTEKGDKVLDPFCGSGTTMIEAAQCGRIGYGIEISANFCGYIAFRMSEVTGEKVIVKKGLVNVNSGKNS